MPPEATPLKNEIAQKKTTFGRKGRNAITKPIKKLSPK